MNYDTINIYLYACFLLSCKTVFREGAILSLPRPKGATVSISSRTIFRVFSIPGPCPLTASSTFPTDHCDHRNPPTHFLMIPGEETSGSPRLLCPLSGPRGVVVFWSLRFTQSLSVIGMPDSMQEPELGWISSCCWEILQHGSRLWSAPPDPTPGPSLLTDSAYGDGGLLLGVTSRAP